MREDGVSAYSVEFLLAVATRIPKRVTPMKSCHASFPLEGVEDSLSPPAQAPYETLDEAIRNQRPEWVIGSCPLRALCSQE